MKGGRIGEIQGWNNGNSRTPLWGKCGKYWKMQNANWRFKNGREILRKI